MPGTTESLRRKELRRISDTDRGRIVRAQVADPPAGESRLHAFCRLFWPTIENRPFVDGPHLHAKCEALTLVHTGEIKKLVINEPPNSGKSVFCNVLWPAYIWAEIDQGFKFAFASYDIGLVNRDAKRFVEVLQSPLFQAAYPELSLDPGQPIQDFSNDDRGHRFGTTPGRAFTGRHFGGHVYDDLIKPADIVDGVPGEHQAALQDAMHWLRFTASNRAEDPENLWRVVIGQRLHEADPSGQLLAEGEWEHLCLPERYVPDAPWRVGELTKSLEWRTEAGQLLWPQRRGAKAVAEAEKNLRTFAAVSAQLQQNPTPATGGILHKPKFRRYDVRPRLLDCQIIASLDLSFKGDSVEQSRTAGQLWAKFEERCYLLDVFAGHLTYAQTKAILRVLKLHPLWAQAQTWVIEDKANGPALQSDLESEFSFVAYDPGNANKVARMLPYVEDVHNGLVLFPQDSSAPWVDEVIEEISKVPRGIYNDHWDCMSQALSYLVHGATSFKQAYDNWQQIRSMID